MLMMQEMMIEKLLDVRENTRMAQHELEEISAVIHALRRSLLVPPPDAGEELAVITVGLKDGDFDVTLKILPDFPDDEPITLDTHPAACFAAAMLDLTREALHQVSESANGDDDDGDDSSVGDHTAATTEEG